MLENDLVKRLKNSGLRVTPQRSAVLLALTEHGNHPDAESLVKIVREQYANIAVGTIYHILDVFVQKGIIIKVETEQNVVRYDAILEPHIHLYSKEEKIIKDYFDEELFAIIQDYISKKKISDFKVEDIRIKFIGAFNTKTN